MCRQIRWNIVDGEHRWTAKTRPSWTLVDFSFSLEASVVGAVYRKNAILKVRKRENGEKIAKKVVVTREFESGWYAKYAIDAMLTLAKVLHGDDQAAAEEWFLETLRNYKNPIPEPVPEYYKNNAGTRLYYH